MLFRARRYPRGFPGQPPSLALHRHDLKTRKTDVAAAGVQFFEVSQSGDKMLIRQADNWYIRNLPPVRPAPGGPLRRRRCLRPRDRAAAS